MRLVVRNRLPEPRLRAALRRAATRALAGVAARRAEDRDLGRLPATSMLGEAFRPAGEAMAGRMGIFPSSKIDEN